MGGTMGAGVGVVSSVGRDPCFPAGTPVLMADGTTRPIEDVAVGDHVACTDPDTGQPTTSTVTRTFTHEHAPGSPDSNVTMAAPVGGGQPPNSPAARVHDASIANSIDEAPAEGRVHRLPAGTEFPEGLAAHTGGADVTVNEITGSRPEGHRAICPDRSRFVDDFNREPHALP
jgi:YD repeat protein